MLWRMYRRILVAKAKKRTHIYFTYREGEMGFGAEYVLQAQGYRIEHIDRYIIKIEWGTPK